jgi:C-terminal processing protease CtpA/Prc
MTTTQQIENKLNNLNKEDLKKIIIDLFNNTSDESDIILSIATTVLYSKTNNETTEYADFLNSID